MFHLLTRFCALIFIFILTYFILSKNKTENKEINLVPTASSAPIPTESPIPTSMPKPTIKATPKITGNISSGWRLTVYYTPVEKYHGGEEEHVAGIGSFSKLFLDLVRLEGVGKISKGPHENKYIHHTDQLGFWLTQQPLDAQGKVLVAFRTMAAPIDIKFGTKVKIYSCEDIVKQICNQISNYTWTVSDRFGDTSKKKHLDLYIGEEDQENFLQSSPYIFQSLNSSVAFY